MENFIWMNQRNIYEVLCVFFLNEKYTNRKNRLLESARGARFDVTFRFCGKSSKAKETHDRCTTTNTGCEARQERYLSLELQFDKLLCKHGRCKRLPWWQSRTMVCPRKNASGAFFRLLSPLRGVWVLLKPVSKAFKWELNTECKTLRVCLCFGGCRSTNREQRLFLDLGQGRLLAKAFTQGVRNMEVEIGC